MNNNNNNEEAPEGGQPLPPPSDIVQHMVVFLRRHGLHETEACLQREAAANPLLDISGKPGPVIICELSGKDEQDPKKKKKDVREVRTELASLLMSLQGWSDMWLAEVIQIIFPVFAHGFLRLICQGHNMIAKAFADEFSLRIPATYGELAYELSLISNPDQVATHPYAQHLLKNPFLVKFSPVVHNQLQLALERLPIISAIIQDHIQIETMETPWKLKSSMDWQIGGYLGQVSKIDTRTYKVHYGIMREDCIAPLEKRRSKTKDDAKRRELAAPAVDRIPLPPLSEALRSERHRAHKEYSKMIVLGPDQPPSVCLFTTLNAHGGVSACDVSDDSTLLALGFGDSGISVFALNNEQPMMKLKQGEELEKLDCESDDIAMEMLDPNTQSTSIGLIGHSGPVYSLNFSPEKRLIISSSGDRTLRLWSMATQTNVLVINTESPVWQASFCQRGYYYATGSASGVACLWATERKQPLRIFADAYSDVSSVHFHPNCNYIVGGSDDRYVRMWDVQSGTCVRTFSAHRDAVRSVKFSPCGRYISSVSADGVLCVWDIASSRLVGAHTAQQPTTIPSQSFSREGGTLAVSRGSESLAFYSLDDLLFDSSYTSSEFMNEPKIDMPGFEVAVYKTKRTPVVGVHFTRRNLLLGIGAYNQ